jgi:hypothetical protein
LVARRNNYIFPPFFVPFTISKAYRPAIRDKKRPVAVNCGVFVNKGFHDFRLHLFRKEMKETGLLDC